MKMMTSGLVVLAVLAGPTFAAEDLAPAAQAGKEQLAAQLGVDVDVYSYSDLVALNCRMMSASSEDEKAKLLAGFSDMSASRNIPGTHAEQLAAELGVDAANYSLEQLVYIKGLIEGQDCTIEEAEKIVALGEEIAPEAVNAKAQIAALLGVEPSDYTLHELVALKFDVDN